MLQSHRLISIHTIQCVRIFLCIINTNNHVTCEVVILITSLYAWINVYVVLLFLLLLFICPLNSSFFRTMKYALRFLNIYTKYASHVVHPFNRSNVVRTLILNSFEEHLCLSKERKLTNCVDYSSSLKLQLAKVYERFLSINKNLSFLKNMYAHANTCIYQAIIA